MKNKIIILTVLFTLSLSCFSQQQYVNISGYVLNIANGNPVPNHAVDIVADTSVNPNGFNYSNQVYTDVSGFYDDTISLSNNQNGFYTQGTLKVSTYDCMNTYFDTLVSFYSGLYYLNANFNICDSLPSNNCVADFWYYVDTTNLNTIHFIDISIGNINSWNWNFSDGSTSTDQNPIYTYTNNGTYNVCLIASEDSAGFVICSDTFCLSITIGSNCQADFFYSLDSIANLPNAFHFSDNSIGNINSWSWDFGDGTTSVLQNPYHLFPDSGSYYVCLTVGNGSCSDVTCETIYVGPVNKFNVGGQVFAGNYPIDEGRAYLYSVYNNQITLTDSMYFDTYGYYYFYHALEGNYIVKIFPVPGNQYVPTYFGNTLKWTNASTVNLNDSIYNADVNMINYTLSTGPGSISGYLTYYYSGVSFTEILLLGMNGNVVNYTYTDTSGDFGFNNLAYGTYILYAEEAGKYTIPDTITIDASNPAITNIQLALFDANATGIINHAGNQASVTIGDIFPNPVLDELNVEINLASSADLIFRIFNTIGQQIKENKITLPNGKHLIRLPADDLPGGIYLLNISSADGKINNVRKFIR